MHQRTFVSRKLLLLIALVILPGGLIALVIALLGRRLARTRRGRAVLATARAQASRFPRLGNLVPPSSPAVTGAAPRTPPPPLA